MSPTLAVVFDFGSASPLSIAGAADGLCDLVFVVDPASTHVRASMPLLEAIGPVVDLGDARLLDRLRRFRIDGVVAFGDTELVPAARIAEAFGLRYHDVGTARALADKSLQRARLAGVAGCAARFAPIDDPAAAADTLHAVGRPAVVKPRQGAGSRNTVRVDSPESLAAAVEQARRGGDDELIVEELLVGDPSVAGAAWGDYVSVESVVRDGAVTHLGVTGKPPLAEPFRERGAFFPSTLGPSDQQAVRVLVSRALGALGVRWGLCHTEVKLTAHGPRLIEVNGRLGGYVDDVYERATGTGLVRLALAEALGWSSPAPPAARAVAYQLAVAPPTWARRVEQVSGARDVGRLPGVTRLDLVHAAGAPVDWRDGTSSWVAVLHGTVADHGELDAVRTALETRLHVDYS